MKKIVSVLFLLVLVSVLVLSSVACVTDNIRVNVEQDTEAENVPVGSIPVVVHFEIFGQVFDFLSTMETGN